MPTDRNASFLKIQPHNLHLHHAVADLCQKTEKAAHGRIIQRFDSRACSPGWICSASSLHVESLASSASATAKYAPTSRIFALPDPRLEHQLHRLTDSPRQRQSCRLEMPPPCVCTTSVLTCPCQEIIEHARREEHRAARSRRCATNHDAIVQVAGDVASPAPRPEAAHCAPR